MTTATVAPATGTQFAVLLVMTLLIGFILGVILWRNEGHDDKQDDKLDTHDEQLATLTYELGSLKDFLRVDIPKPAVDDSPQALQVYGGLAEADKPADDAKTDEFPAVPATEPDGIAIQVQSALLARDLSEEFPHPTDSDAAKAKQAAWVEEQMAKFQFTGRDR